MALVAAWLQATQLEASVVQATQPEASLVQATQLEPVRECFERMHSLAWSCCDTRYGPRGRNSCWDKAFTFERCCKEVNLVQAAQLEASVVQNNQLEASLVQATQLEPVHECFERMHSLAWSCCDTRYGPRGRNTCWDKAFTFERCCKEVSLVQAAQLEASVVQNKQLEASLVQATQLEPVHECFERMHSLAWSCCDTRYGPRGRNTCWDKAFTFERCCKEVSLVQAAQLEASVVQNNQLEASLVQATQLEPVHECFERMHSLAWSCCDTRYGPRGRNSCWDKAFTFERCCKEVSLVQTTHLEASLVQNNQLEASLVQATQLEPVHECFERMHSLAWSCCDTRYGPRGRNTCWDKAFTFERCCKEVYRFDLKHCCSTSSRCLDFAFQCGPGRPCHIRPRRLETMRRHMRRFGPNATMCDDGSRLFPPSIVVTEKSGDLESGRQLSLKGSLFSREPSAKVQPRAAVPFGSPSDPCLGRFFAQEDLFGTCSQSHFTKRPSLSGKGSVFALSQPWRDLNCASVCRKDCKIYAAEVVLEVDEDLSWNRLVVAVPGACSNAEVAFRVLPGVVSQRSPSALHMTEVELYHFVPGDPCEHSGRPSSVQFLLTSMAMLFLPQLLLGFANKRNAKDDLQTSVHPEGHDNTLDFVNLLRVVALWYTCCFHWGITFPFRSLLRSIEPWATYGGNINVAEVRLQTCFEGLHVIIGVFLVLQCNDWQTFGQRLIRKVGRQVLVMYFICSALPWLQYASGPMNCIREPDLQPRVVTSVNFFLIGAEWTWAVQMDMHTFLLVGSLGVLRRHLPQVLPAACVLYWAYFVSLSRGPGGCIERVTIADHVRWVTHFSFWLHWFPTSLVLLNLDTFLRKPQKKLQLVRLKVMLGHLWHIVIATILLLCFLLSATPHLQDWQSLGFSSCPTFWGLSSPSISYVLLGLPFHLTVYTCLHSAAQPGQQVHAGNGVVLSQERRERLGGISIVKGFCSAFRDTNLAFNLWHQEVFWFGKAHFPAWISLLRVAQRDRSTLEEQFLFFAPLVLGTYTLAWLTYHCVERPWARLLRKVSQSCPPMLIFLLCGTYFVARHAAWYANRRTWGV